MATLVVVTFNDKKESWFARPSTKDPGQLCLRQIIHQEHFLADDVDIEAFVVKLKEEQAELDVTTRVFKEV